MTPSAGPLSGDLERQAWGAFRPPDGSEVRVGVDLVVVADVGESIERLGDRYLQRVFTPHELSCCLKGPAPDDRRPAYSTEALAARFAAKEAVVKVLRPVGSRPEWRSIEVRRAGGGWCEIVLSGSAASTAADAGIDQWALSLTHESTMAGAVVVAVCRTGGRGDTSLGTDRTEER
ncbi:MAG: holo-ACP synthase [Acidimicrobiales bacterium]